MEIKQNLTNTNFNRIDNKTNKYIVIHYVAAVSSAYNNTVYFKDVCRNASANYFVDEEEVWQCVADNDVAWHCGDNLKNGNGGKYNSICTNRNSIGIEMCCYDNNGYIDISNKVIENTIELVKSLMSKYNIPVENVIRHFDVTNKICPKPFVDDLSRWENFKSRLGDIKVNASEQIVNASSDENKVSYQTWEDIKNIWLPNVSGYNINDNNNGYAGRFGSDVCCIYISANVDIYYKVHVLGGKWLPEVKNRNDYAGMYNKPIDAIMIRANNKTVKYKVHLRNKNRWLGEVDGYNEFDVVNGYAGVLGNPIDAVAIKIA